MSTLVAAKNSFGATFSFCPGPATSTGGTFVALANVLSITAPTYSRGTIDVSNWGLSSGGTGDGYEQCISGGPIRSGNVGLSAVYLSTDMQVTTLPAAFDAGIVNGWKIVIPGCGATENDTWWGNGIITGYNITGLNSEGMVTFDMNMKVVGQPIFNAGTSV